MYLRKSREDIEREKQTGEDVLQAHRERLSNLLLSKGMTKWIERAEVKTGDTIAVRPIFRGILDGDLPSASGKKIAISVTEISRLGRGDMEDAGRIYKTIIQYNIWLLTPHKDYNPKNQADLRQIRFELFLSREEYEMIKERMWQRRNERGKQGYAANYIITLGLGQNRGKVFEIPEESRLVLEIFERRAEGMSYNKIATLLNDRGLITKRGTKYHPSTIRKIIYNPRYIGKAKWCGQYYESKGPAIVPLELWNYVHQEVNAHLCHHPIPKENSPYLVQLFCRECNNRMYGEWVKIHRHLKTGKLIIYNEYGTYVCVGKRKKPKCTHQQRLNYVHDLVLQELKNILFMPKITEQLILDRKKKLSYDNEGLREKLIFKEKEIRAKKTFLDKCKQDYKNGHLAANLYTDHYDETTREINILIAEMKDLKERLEKATLKIENPDVLFARLKEAVDNWDSIPNITKKKIILAFLPHISISKDGTLHVIKNLPARL